LGALELVENKLLIFDGAKRGIATILGDGGRPPENAEEKIEALQLALHPAYQFSAIQDEEDYPAITAAIEWYQDSLFAENQTFSYLAACIGLEAILGGDDRIDNMSSRLTDRYSFLLGKDRAERKRLAKEYHEVLRTRGELVHAKQARLTGASKAYLPVAQQMLLNTIWHELQRVYRNQRNK
jgi:Apea-like HEPN